MLYSRMGGRKVTTLIIFLYISMVLCGQKKWDGEAGDGLWSTPVNWVGDVLPSAGEDVVLDHSVSSSNYIVLLPSGSVAVIIRSLTIFPGVSKTIQVLLPATNTALPGFTATGSDYGLIIFPGGIFRNSSGAAAGTPVSISDSIKIHNGGLYIHNTSRAHAANVTVLSRAPGTEEGSFEFDVPGGSGYTVSIAGRVYGNLILSAIAAGGTKSYTSTGSTPVNINGEFRINAGVNYSLNFSAAFIVHGNYFHSGNTFDISSGLFSNTLALKGNIDQSGIITESGTGAPVVELSGNSNQLLSFAGLTGTINLRVANARGVTLRAPLFIHYKLQLGIGNIRSNSHNILVIEDDAVCSGGSSNSFIEGPVRKIGDDDFDFPIGKPGDYAPVTISGSGGAVTDQFEAEYLIANPVLLFGTAVENPPIIRVSRLEYWNLRQIVGSSPKRITVSVRTYSNATLLEKLVITRWDTVGSIWKSEGNSAFNGIASGTITSNVVNSFGNFTIASIVDNQNPLPVFALHFTATKLHQNALLSWRVPKEFDPVSFDVLKSIDGRKFELVERIIPSADRLNYQYFDKLIFPGVYYFRLKVVSKTGSSMLSEIQTISYQQNGFLVINCYPSVTKNSTNLLIAVSEEMVLQLFVNDSKGRIVQKIGTRVYTGSPNVVVDLSRFSPGVYYLSGTANRKSIKAIKFVKL